MLEEFLAKKEFPGKLIFAKLWGSRSHNTQKPESDWDYSGVYVVPTRQVLGLDTPDESIQNKEEQKPDYAFYEIGKFARLLLVGNPGILEMLFTDKHYIETDDWKELKQNSHRFLSKKAVSQYTGYVEGQLRRLKAGVGLHTKGGTYNEKWAYHAARIILDGQRIAQGQHPVVWKSGEEKNFLMEIRNDQTDRQKIVDFLEIKLEQVKNTKNDLPEFGDKEFLDNWLVNLRLKSL